jgi:hypothetical protein
MSTPSLTEKDRLKISHIITLNTDEEDRDPQEIIKEDYGGDIDLYLRTMAEFYNIPIDE